MKKLLYALALVLVLASSGSAGNLSNLSGVANIQSTTIRNGQALGPSGAIANFSIPASPNANIHIYQIWAYCSSGTAALTITDGVSGQIYSTPVGAIGTTIFTQNFSPALTISTGNIAIVSLGACSGSGNGTLNVQADQY